MKIIPVFRLLGTSLITSSLGGGIAAWADVPPPPALDTSKTKSVEAFTPILPHMVTIPAGTFTMGCKNGRDNVEGLETCSGSETPVHKVMVKTFQLAEKEVTFAEWDICVNEGECEDLDDSDWGRGNRPVIDVSWDDAQTYIGWLNKRTSKRYRLPTETEWEYASRAGNNDAAYFWGQTASSGKANCKGCALFWDYKQTTQVGNFTPNAYGLYDMHGNVWEWVQDEWHDSYEGAPTDGSSWEDSDSSTDGHVQRGGSWNSEPIGMRSAYRHSASLGRNDIRVNNYNSDGFRLALGQE